MTKHAYHTQYPGGRSIHTANIKGRAVRIVVGYDIHSDLYLWHLYVDDAKIGSDLADSDQEALDAAEQLALANVG